MGVEFDNVAESPYTARLRLSCDICRRENLSMELQLITPVDRISSQELLAQATMTAASRGWRWENPGQGGQQLILCRECHHRHLALPWDGSTPTFRREVMGEFPEPSPIVDPATGRVRVDVNGGLAVDMNGRPQVVPPWSVDVPPGQHTVGVDLARDPDECVAQVVIDGKPTGQTIKMRRPEVGPLRKSKWDRLMEDDDECP